MSQCMPNLQGNGYVGIDLDNFKILFKTKDMQSACLLSAMDYEDCTHLIFPIERSFPESAGAKSKRRDFPKFLTTREMYLIWPKLSDNPAPKTIGELMGDLHDLLLDFPYHGESLFQLERRAGSEPLEADEREIERKPYYQPVSVPVKSGPAIPSAPIIPSAPSVGASLPPWLAQAAPASAPTPSIPSAPSIPKAPIPSALPSAPKAGSTTGRVWAIADELFSKSTIQPPNLKELKTLVVGECEAQGINPGTAGTQFGAWKRARGL